MVQFGFPHHPQPVEIAQFVEKYSPASISPTILLINKTSIKVAPDTSPLSLLQRGGLVDFVQNLQYLGQPVVLVRLEVWLWLRLSLVKCLPRITEPPLNVDLVSGVLQDTLGTSCHLQGVDVNLVIILSITPIMWICQSLVVFIVFKG